jgi:S1-C subfamily serine protease
VTRSRPFARRIARGAARAGALTLLLAGPAVEPVAAAAPITHQDVLLRAKPATVLVVAEVTSDVTVDCGSGPRQVTPNPFRETGTGWFVDSNGWVVTNGHVVQPAHETPQWLINEQAELAARGACGRDVPARVVAGAKVDAKPTLYILLSNGFRLPVKVAKYSPPVSTQTGAGVMSGRDLALLQVEAAELPAMKPSSRKAAIGDPIHILASRRTSRTSRSSRPTRRPPGGTPVDR